jgi:hypothetical protein
MEKILNWELFLESRNYVAINEEIAMREIWDKAINKIKEIPKISQNSLKLHTFIMAKKIFLIGQKEHLV